MKKLFFLPLLFLAFYSNAQVYPPEGFQTPTEKQELQLEKEKVVPVTEESVQGRLVCSWADGAGGSLECSSGAVSCTVLVRTGTNQYYIGCIDRTGRVTNYGLDRRI